MSVAAGSRLERQANIDIGYDYRFEDAWGHFERYVWLFFVLLLIAGLLGFFGRGPLNQVKRTLNNGVSVEYERVVRFKSPTIMQFTLPAPDGIATIELSKHAVNKLGVQQTFPLPTHNLGSAQVGPLQFEAAPGAKNVLVEIAMQPASLGPVTSSFRINGQSDIQIKQFILP